LYSMNRDHRSLFNHPEFAKHVDVINYKELRQIYDFTQALCDGQYPDHSTVVIDTIGGWCDLFLREIAKNVKFGDNSRKILQPRPGEKNAAQFIKEMNLVANEQTDYNILRIEVQEIVRRLCSSNLNIIFNSHYRLAENDKIDTYTHFRPDIAEKTYHNIVEEVDVMGFFKKGNTGIPSITFGGGPTVASKSRVAELENKTFSHPDKFVEAVNTYLASV